MTRDSALLFKQTSLLWNRCKQPFDTSLQAPWYALLRITTFCQIFLIASSVWSARFLVMVACCGPWIAHFRVFPICFQGSLCWKHFTSAPRCLLTQISRTLKNNLFERESRHGNDLICTKYNHSGASVCWNLFLYLCLLMKRQVYTSVYSSKCLLCPYQT